VTYHVPASIARNTGMFFWVPKKAMLVQLDYREHSYPDNPENISSYWSIKIYFQFQSGIGLRSEPEEGGIPFFGADGLRYFDFEGPDYRFTCNGGGLGAGPNTPLTGHYDINQVGSWEEPIRFEPVVGHLVLIWDSASKHLGRLPFTELQVTSFPQYYSFPGSETIFWKRFDRRNLRALVARPWGSEGLGR